ncbi:hypothetical protein ACFE04_011137 [Oxalis oulophora]
MAFWLGNQTSSGHTSHIDDATRPSPKSQFEFYPMQVYGINVVDVIMIELVKSRQAMMIGYKYIPKYLSQFGFLRQHDPRLGSILHKDTFTKAIREFQNFANLEVTGELNNETIRIMKIPICGVEDKRNPRPVEHSRFRRYILAGENNNHK